MFAQLFWLFLSHAACQTSWGKLPALLGLFSTGRVGGVTCSKGELGEALQKNSSGRGPRQVNRSIAPGSRGVFAISVL